MCLLHMCGHLVDLQLTCGVTLFQSATFKSECGDTTEFAACAAALPDGLGAQLTEIGSAATAPETQNKIALPTIFKMWQEKFN